MGKEQNIEHSAETIADCKNILLYGDMVNIVTNRVRQVIGDTRLVIQSKEALMEHY